MVAPAHSARSAVVIACWYAANIGVLLLNKYILSVYGFRFPVFMTLCHMCMCSVLSATAREIDLVPKQYIRSRKQFAKVAILAVTRPAATPHRGPRLFSLCRGRLMNRCAVRRSDLQTK